MLFFDCTLVVVQYRRLIEFSIFLLVCFRSVFVVNPKVTVFPSRAKFVPSDVLLNALCVRVVLLLYKI